MGLDFSHMRVLEYGLTGNRNYLEIHSNAYILFNMNLINMVNVKLHYFSM